MIDTGDRALARPRIANITLDEGKALPLLWRDQTLDFIQIVLIAGGKIIQADHMLIELEQAFKQIRADKAGAACHQPAARVRLQRVLDFTIPICHETPPYRRRSDSAAVRTYLRS